MVVAKEDRLKMSDLSEERFEKLLEESREKCETRIEDEDKKFETGTEFENFVSDIFEGVIEESEVDSDLFKHHSSQKFPDLSVGVFGVEIKLSKSGWGSTGNSIYEGNRVDRVEDIYFFFLRQDTREIRTEPYEECLEEIVVTHSPRYSINMDLDEGESVFSKMGMSYKDFTERGYPTSEIKNYMREKYEGEDVWFIDSEEEVISATVKDWGRLEKGRKKELKAEIMVLFPDVFSNKFFRPSRYLLEKYQIICHNMRDPFTAGGRGKLNIRGSEEEVPAIYLRLNKLAGQIEEILQNLDEEKLKDEWNITKMETDPEEKWLELLEDNSDREDVAEIYRSGLD